MSNPSATRSRAHDRWLVWTGAASLLLLAGVAGYVVLGTEDADRSAVPGQLMVWDVSRPGLARAQVLWASEVREHSSQRSDDEGAARQALGLPDVFPRSGDSGLAWAPDRPDRGSESITVAFTDPVRASAVVVVETEGPGSLAEVTDVTPGREPSLLWRGRTGVEGGARVLSIELPTPREMSAVRIGLDTTRVAGVNQIDAIGLVPARPGG